MLLRAQQIVLLAGVLGLLGPGCKKSEDTQAPAEAAAKSEAPVADEKPAPEEEESPYLHVSNFNRVV